MANENRIQIADGKFLEIKLVAVVGDTYDADGNIITQEAVVRLNTQEVESLGIANIQEIANKFYNNTIPEGQ